MNQQSKYFDAWDQMDPIPVAIGDRRLFTGEKCMMVHNTILPKETIPTHKHPHEQLFFVLSGACDVTVCGETRHLVAGGVAWFPGDEEHTVVNTLDEPLIALDVFSPIREDFLAK